MKIVHVHNFYQQNPSGENVAVIKTVNELIKFKRKEDEVALISFFHNSGFLRLVDILKISVNFLFGITFFGKNNMELFSRAEVLHFHNILPFCGRRIISLSKKRGKKVVLTIHNSRSSCLNGSHIYRSEKCFRCPSSQSFVPGIMRKCYRGSLIQSAIFSFMNNNILKDYKNVDKFIVLSDFSKKSLMKIGIDEKRINILTTHVKKIDLCHLKKRQVFYGGRLDFLKGVDLVIQAWILSDMFKYGWQFLIAGSGPLVNQSDLNRLKSFGIYFMGLLSEDEVDLVLRDTAYVVVPSRTYEGMPRMVSKAAASGCKVLISDTGSLADLRVHSWTKVLGLELNEWKLAFNEISLGKIITADQTAVEWWQANANESELARKYFELYGDLA